MIEIEHVSKSYEEYKVLDDVSTQIPKGCITAFIGPNGAGKSTLLGIITRMNKADGGRILVDGKDVKDYDTSALARKISVLRQNNNLHLRITVKELVSFGRYPYAKGNLRAEDKRIVEEAIQYMGLVPLKDRYIDELSGGEQQRAFIAMVVAQDTDYIFLDEPLNNLDMKHSVEIMSMLRRLCQEKEKTVVIVIHDINFASCYSDRILAIQGGKIRVNDTVDAVITPKMLKSVYNMDFQVYDIEGDKISVYYKKKHHRRGKHYSRGVHRQNA
ncbi:iron ABC transporter ATP-binding protein [Kineothrix sp. MB12-C1]|uniref:iron ABC transporter ATP-binding protein n=1 Tax=Kineothrix sp. MB12-C1 TaxID=3070215 RepID=UPI0027D26572|nr:ATP-binding cassette domain-containing protein [Kineothrix sp. MB12-C1]WMC93235.1 ATP-binding cassette domain-containing protein [Kineothrix sp. MB12-C1]